ncbi:phosphomannomutase/phosphoglucomutase [Neoehrlichia mikurensis]|uniref:Phosphomannomutase/phosphoglucomutase n=1 Tax=Neoehrlichia mikurensis TaxID=89586 RepID=A0A9Q9F3K8_9RICK|nr:phosphomannomutase/phosphoglucomutase [Neoehrlichia mikurensis]QXK92059.1 phosphomannomutase/phosphoglucomutase [Neoehrlichia mikurensis]QXK92516.1 phosphomannomutase/phosphoglucomutase [Neoehrlichia mikurensis]QXK93752.1 phosphomannomutase/phosphoglucomutase [Neoehrlichia mikurensis]UTO55277.1 phosphomannomutase/phosphoglucomutase [Neoehrlichia mikurensis]UTO56197.1 phosphomannomutase/phosphoglucomutase [Neoehrlichia mikurensis]
MINKSIINKYDIRGVVGSNLHISDAYEIGIKFSKFIGKGSIICVGYDGRVHAYEFAKNVTSGIIHGGSSVVKLGLCSSPMLYFANKIMNANGGIMVTASHNPQEYQGFKIIGNNNLAVKGCEILTFLYRYECSDIANNKGVVIDININSSYLASLEKVFSNVKMNKLKIAWDCSNGVMSSVVYEVIKILYMHDHIVINEVIDGYFPGHLPDISVHKNLCQIVNTVKKNNCDIGIVFDGDGDRVCFIDNCGNIVTNDHVMMIFIEDILTQCPGSTIIYDIKSSEIIKDIVDKLGGKAIACASGYSIMQRKMRDEHAKFAGEISGHMFFEELGYDDGMYAAMRMINILLKTKMTLTQLVGNLPKLYIIPEMRIKIQSNSWANIVTNLKQILDNKNIKYIDIDGIKVQIGDKGWWIVRNSNTENMITIRCEGTNLTNLKYVKNLLYYYIQCAL